MSGCTDNSKSQPGNFPRLPLPPSRKLKALATLRSQLKQKLRELPDCLQEQDPVQGQNCCNAGIMAAAYLKAQKDIAHKALQVR